MSGAAIMRHLLPLVAAIALSVPNWATADNATPTPNTGPATGPTADKVVRLATEGAFPPFNALDADGQPIGFEIDLGNAICTLKGWTCEWVLHDWASITDGLVDGKFDAVMAGMAITPTRLKKVSFSREYFPSGSRPQGMFVGTHTFQDPAASVISVQKNTIHEDHLKSLGFQIKTYPTAGAALDAVLSGMCDLTFGSPDFLEQRVYQTSRSLAIVGRLEINAGGAAIAFAKESETLRQDFNTALDALEADGTIGRLQTKWFTKTTDL